MDAISKLLVLAVSLAVAKLLEEVFARFKYPPVLGDILAGFVLGPTVLGLLFEDETFEVLAELGIIAVMFVAGLETKYTSFVKSLKDAGIVSVVEVVIAFSIGTLIGVFVLGLPLNKAFIVGSILSATSISVTVRTLLELGKLATVEGNMILAVAVLDDVLGLLVLSIAVEAAKGAIEFVDLAIIVAMASVTWAIIVAGGHRASPLITKAVLRMRVEGSRPAMILAIVLLMAYLAKEVRLAPIVGAYAIGVALSESTLAKPIEDKLRIFADILGTFFFVYAIGKMDFKIVMRYEYTMLYITVVSAAIFGKVAGGTIGGALVKLGFKRSLRVGVGLIPMAEVCMIAATIGHKIGAIPLEMYFAAILVVYVTSLITPVLLKLVFKD